MLHQGLTFIPLLLLLCQHALGLKVFQSIGSENNDAVITCDDGKIIVLSSNHGIISDTGTYGFETWPVHDTCNGLHFGNERCHKDTTEDVSQKCDGLQTCTYAVDNEVLNYQSEGHSRYLDVSYSCGPDPTQKPFDCGENGCRVFSICQFEKQEFGCTSGRMTVKYASYGRRSSEICPHSNSSLTSSLCFSDQTSIVKLLCDDKPTCKLYVSSLVYLDLCPHLYKYLTVMYTCK
ncbi:L-rhamnose-binding lectin CSL3-like isoform X1 [Misgurnus anguillicaudatus]|uniref:L-rhamnose-binding lectin CSL3-like isoform X1 n=1 Tax=Misgurnus anguillicaudatus TaxID=75329 RepID=UPI003CCFAFE6